MSDPNNEKITPEGVPTDEVLPEGHPSDPNATDTSATETHETNPDLMKDDQKE